MNTKTRLYFTLLAVIASLLGWHLSKNDHVGSLFKTEGKVSPGNSSLGSLSDPKAKPANVPLAGLYGDGGRPKPSQNLYPAFYVSRKYEASTQQKAAAERLRLSSDNVRLLRFDAVGGSPTIKSTSGMGESHGAKTDPVEVIASFVEAHQDLFLHDSAQVRQASRRKSVTLKGDRYVTLEQSWNGLPVFGGTIEAVIDSNGRLLSIADRFLASPSSSQAAVALPPNAVPTNAKIASTEALRLAGASVGESNVPLPPLGPVKMEPHMLTTQLRQARMPNEREGVRLVWDMAFESKTNVQAFRALVDAESGMVRYRQELGCSVTPPLADPNVSFNVWANTNGAALTREERGFRQNQHGDPGYSPDDGFAEVERVVPQDAIPGSSRNIIGNVQAAASIGYEADGSESRNESPNGGSRMGWLVASTSGGNSTYSLNGIHFHAFAGGITPQVTVATGSSAVFDSALGSVDATTVQAFYTANWVADRFAGYEGGDVAGRLAYASPKMLLDARNTSAQMVNNAGYLPQVILDGVLQGARWVAQDGAGVIHDPDSELWRIYGIDDLQKHDAALTLYSLDMPKTGPYAYLWHLSGPPNYTDTYQSVATAGKIVAGVFNLPGAPNRDAALDTSVVAHEWGHALSAHFAWGGNGPPVFSNYGLVPLINQNTGNIFGGTSPADIPKVQAELNSGLALSEAISDFVALLALTPSSQLISPGANGRHGAFPIGSHVAPYGVRGSGQAGIRRHPYSQDKDINPITLQNHASGLGRSYVVYNELAQPILNTYPQQYNFIPIYSPIYFIEEHQYGEVWASILWDIRVNLIDEFNALYPGENERAYRLASEAMWEWFTANIPQLTFGGLGYAWSIEHLEAADNWLSNGGYPSRLSDADGGDFRGLVPDIARIPDVPGLSRYEATAYRRAIHRGFAARGLGMQNQNRSSPKVGSYVSDFTALGSKQDPFRVVCETKIVGNLAVKIGGQNAAVTVLTSGHRSVLTVSPPATLPCGAYPMVISITGNTNKPFGYWDWTTTLNEVDPENWASG
jgi:hypothetical protein